MTQFSICGQMEEDNSICENSDLSLLMRVECAVWLLLQFSANNNAKNLKRSIIGNLERFLNALIISGNLRDLLIRSCCLSNTNWNVRVCSRSICLSLALYNSIFTMGILLLLLADPVFPYPYVLEPQPQNL